MTSLYDIQICTISDQVDPNLFSIFDKRYRPQKVYFLVTKEMKEKAEFLRKAISPGLVKVVEFREIKNQVDFKEIQDVYEKLLIEECPDPSKVLVNITGGTKPMAITASRVCEDFNVDYLYASIAEKDFLFFPSKKEPTADESSKKVMIERQKMHLDGMTLDLYLKAHGVTIRKAKNSKEIAWEPLEGEKKEFVDFVVSAPQKVREAIKALNFVISQNKSGPNNLKRPVEAKLLTDGFNGLIDKLNEYGIADYQDGSLVFKSLDMLNFVAGRWLEQYTAEILANLGLNIEPVNLEFLYENNRIRNELDVVFFYENCLYVVEVKTSVINREQVSEESNHIQDIVHKLSNLSGFVGGISCKKAIVSYFESGDRFKARTNASNITFIGDSALRRENTFKGELKKWIMS